MQAVKIKLYQNMVNYRKEMSYGYVQTYPLPTPSMIRGMAHALLELNKYHNMRISVQGNHTSVVTNMQKVYKFDRERKSRPKNPYDVTVGKSQKTALHGILFVDEIVDMNVVLHICFDQPELNTKLLEAVKQKTVILGRNEDIARLDFEATKLVKLSESDEDQTFAHSIYLPHDLARKAFLKGTAYRLPFYYFPVKSFEDKRIFEFVDVVYISKGSELRETNHIIDEDGDIVSFLEV